MGNSVFFSLCFQRGYIDGKQIGDSVSLPLLPQTPRPHFLEFISLNSLFFK